ncbi:hypothetical protein BRC94_11260 [Halobacteriales archaeon QS_5_70_17]|nr:MAG: hypothetical protein BRC94_11260 [Halobacteriales archaeon QS_5_70_17]
MAPTENENGDESGGPDRPEYDGAAYAVDRASEHAGREEWEDVADRACEALARASPSPYPHLNGDLHRQATDVVLSANREHPDAERISTQLAEMQATVASMIALAHEGASMFPDGVDP